jgi:hypothetical protein
MTFLQTTQPGTLRKVIVMTGSQRQLSCEFLQRVCRVLVKPFDINDLVLMARECVQDSSSCGWELKCDSFFLSGLS